MIECTLESKFKNILIDMLDKESEKELDENQISVTECTDCLRKSFYRRKYKRKYINKHLFEGKAIHHYIEYLVKKYHGDILVEDEYEVDLGYEFTIVMRPDIILDDRVVEIKTSDSNNIIVPHLEHELQANFYAFVLAKDYYEIIYITRGIDICHFVKPVSIDLFNVLIKRARMLYKSIVSDIPPKKELKYCRFCVYYDICLKEGNDLYEK